MAFKANNKEENETKGKTKRPVVKDENSTLADWKRRFKEHPFMFIGTLVILLIVIVAFVLVPAIPGVSNMGIELEFGSYNKTPITLVPGNYFAQQVQGYEELYRYYYGDSYDASNIFLTYPMWRSAFEDTVIHVAKLEEMKKAGYVAPADVVNREIAQLPQFQENGRFSSLKYRQMDSMTQRALFREVQDSLAETRYTNDMVNTLPVSSNEAAFMSQMASPQRSFDMALFSLYDYPETELTAYVTSNSALFRVVHLSQITIMSSEREANQILTTVRDGTATFEDAAKNYSQDSYAETGGDMGIKMAYELTSIIPNEPDRETLLSLPKGELSPLIRLSSGWTFFRAEEEPRAPDMADTTLNARVRLYMMDFERGRIEDWYVDRANELAASINALGFDEALAAAELEKTSFGPVPLNYGDVGLFTTLSSLSDAASIAGTVVSDQNFWQTAFSTPVATPSQPIVIGSYVAILYPVSETALDSTSIEAIESSYSSYWIGNTMNQALRSYFLASDRLNDRFSDAYSQYFQ
ncbi:MAG: SurA N-terminal domain-containing protein [Treponema sp.]|jgi:hypothetical protein|nr:SurA N-terminal domain-containing protein [Treponema sp.]